jgi:hypothetical protein
MVLSLKNNVNAVFELNIVFIIASFSSTLCITKKKKNKERKGV